MIISKTPLRMSFVGGGSDLQDFYTHSMGAVVSTAIDKYIYITINKRFDSSIRVGYSQTETVDVVDDIQHNLVREALRKVDLTQGLEITSIADIPSSGTGLGSSSAFTIGLLKALHAYKGTFTSAAMLAEEAASIEIDILKEPIGKQDHYASAFGGFNYIQFNPDHTVTLEPIVMSPETKNILQTNLLVLYTGLTRSASEILEKQKSNIVSDMTKKDMLKKMVELAKRLRDDLRANNISSFGSILHENWLLKKQLSDKISSPDIDRWYDTAMKHGAEGGKLLGAGGGGFMVFYAPKDRHQAIMDALPELRPDSFNFENEGSNIIFVH
jgi:D-glycero-alpha-D-manno-heptose-7-phosphate kinase